MALVYRDCVKQTTSVTDANDISFDSTEFQGYRTFDEALSDGDTCYYLLDEKVSGQWEIGLGTFTAPSQLARTTVYQSSNSNNKIDLFSGSYPEVSIVTRAATFQTIEDTINAGSAGTSLVAEYEVTGSAASEVEITSLDLNRDIGWTINIEVINGYGTASGAQLFVNGDETATNYSRRYIYSSGSSVSTAGDSRSEAFGTDASVGSVTLSNIEMSLVNGYMVANLTHQSGNTGAALIAFVKKNETVTNVTSLSIKADSGTPLGIGSKIKIYRWLV